MKRILIKQVFIIVFFFFTSIENVYAQFNQLRWDILVDSNDLDQRQSVIDSIVSESFINDFPRLPWFNINKSDFSEEAKQQLMQHFNRTLPVSEINRLTAYCRHRLSEDSLVLLEKATRKGISFESYYKSEFDKELATDMAQARARVRSNISPLYARLLGWLDYQPAIPMLESVLQDSLQDATYARANREEFILNCKLALARMGNKNIENELLDYYRITDLDCTRKYFLDYLNNFFYINTEKSISKVVYLSQKEIKTKMYSSESSIPPAIINSKHVILIYISLIINNYPLAFEDNLDSNFLVWSPKDYVRILSQIDFYTNQIQSLENWLQTNQGNYQINKDRFFYISD